MNKITLFNSQVKHELIPGPSQVKQGLWQSKHSFVIWSK